MVEIDQRALRLAAGGHPRADARIPLRRVLRGHSGARLALRSSTMPPCRSRVSSSPFALTSSSAPSRGTRSATAPPSTRSTTEGRASRRSSSPRRTCRRASLSPSDRRLPRPTHRGRASRRRRRYHASTIINNHQFSFTMRSSPLFTTSLRYASTSTSTPAQYCRELVRRHDYEGYVGTLFAPRRVRSHIMASRGASPS